MWKVPGQETLVGYALCSVFQMPDIYGVFHLHILLDFSLLGRETVSAPSLSPQERPLPGALDREIPLLSL